MTEVQGLMTIGSKWELDDVAHNGTRLRVEGYVYKTTGSSVWLHYGTAPRQGELRAIPWQVFLVELRALPLSLVDQVAKASADEAVKWALRELRS